MNNLKPFKVFLELTYSCNLRCKHCYLGDSLNVCGYADLKKIKKVLVELKESGVIELFVTGGEVALHPNLFEILKFASNLGFLITLLTNGSLFKTDMIDELLKIKLNDVRVSIYDLNEEHDDFVQKKGAFEKSINLLKTLRKNNSIGTAACVVTKSNYKKIQKIHNYLKEHDIPLEVNPLIFPDLEGNIQPLKYRLSYNEFEEFFKNNDVDISAGICSAGVSRFRITPDLKVNPCEMLRSIELGDLNKQSFSDILLSNERKEWIKKFNEINSKRVCNKCEKKAFCSNCIGRANLEVSNLYGFDDFNCKLADLQLNIRGNYENERN